MKKTKFNEGWKYWTGSDAFALVWGIAGDAREVTLPHDIMQEKPAYAESKNGGNTGFRDGDIYNYVKFFFAFSFVIFNYLFLLFYDFFRQ